MEALEVDDISPALEVTEDFFNSFDKLENGVHQPHVFGIHQVPEFLGNEISNKIKEQADGQNANTSQRSIIWERCKSSLFDAKTKNGIHAKEQNESAKSTYSDDPLLAEKEKGTSTFNLFQSCNRRVDRPHSVNDSLDHLEDVPKFKPGHNRSRSDVSHVDWKNIRKPAPLQRSSSQGVHCTSPFSVSRNNNMEADNELSSSFPNILKKGFLETRITPESFWKAYQPSCLDEDPLLSYNIDACIAVEMDMLDGYDSCFQVIFPQDLLRLRTETLQRAQEWMDAIISAANSARKSDQSLLVPLRKKSKENQSVKELQRSKRQSVTTSFLSLLTSLALERGLTAQSFKCAGCQRPIGLSNEKAKVCSYSGWYYCSTCHVDDGFIIPARLIHNWDASKHKVSKQAKEFLEYVYEEPLIDVHQENPLLYRHVDSLAHVVRLRQQLKSLRAYLFSCRAVVAEDLRRRIFPREYLFQQIHLYSLSDLQQVIEGKLAPFLLKIIKFATSHVYSCSLCSQKGFICEICNNGEILYPFEENSTSRCENCGAVFHTDCKVRTVPCPKCVRKELQKKQKSFWQQLDMDGSLDEACSMFELSYQST
eukprot:XP_012826787.1 PREDICTED: pleckstrin homology domain-containing family M member 3 isoform X3 [Xenopus tropicalis]